MTTDQILTGVGLILLLAVGCQVLASRLRIPALICCCPGRFHRAFRNSRTAHYRRPLYFRLGHRDPAVPPASGAAHARSGRCPCFRGPAHRGVRVHPGDGPQEWRARVHRLDGPARDRRRRHCLDVHGRPGGQRDRRRSQDPAGHFCRDLAQRADGEPSAGHDLLFLVRADGQLTAVTQTDTPVPQAGDTTVSLGPVPVAQATDGRLPH